MLRWRVKLNRRGRDINAIFHKQIRSGITLKAAMLHDRSHDNAIQIVKCIFQRMLFHENLKTKIIKYHTNVQRLQCMQKLKMTRRKKQFQTLCQLWGRTHMLIWQKAHKLNDEPVLALANKIMLIPEQIKMAVLKLYFDQCLKAYDIAQVQWMMEYFDEDASQHHGILKSRLKKMQRLYWTRLFQHRLKFKLQPGMCEFTNLQPDFFTKYAINIEDETIKKSSMYHVYLLMDNNDSDQVVTSFRNLSISDPFPPKVKKL